MESRLRPNTLSWYRPVTVPKLNAMKRMLMPAIATEPFILIEKWGRKGVGLLAEFDGVSYAARYAC